LLLTGGIINIQHFADLCFTSALGKEKKFQLTKLVELPDITIWTETSVMQILRMWKMQANCKQGEIYAVR
jgi:hypothetical protein